MTEANVQAQTEEKQWNYIEDEKLTLKVVVRDWAQYFSRIIPLGAIGTAAGLSTYYLLKVNEVFVFETQNQMWSLFAGTAVFGIITQLYCHFAKTEEI